MCKLKAVITRDKIGTIMDKLFMQKPLNKAELWDTAIFITYAAREFGILGDIDKLEISVGEVFPHPMPGGKEND